MISANKMNEKIVPIPIRNEIASYSMDILIDSETASNCIGKENVQKLYSEKKMVVIPYDEFVIMATKSQIMDSFMMQGMKNIISSV